MSTPHVCLPEFKGLTFRAICEADLEAWFALSSRMTEAEDTPSMEPKSALRNVITSSANPVAENTVIAFDSDGVARAAGYVAHNVGSARFFAFGEVDPLWQRRGVGTAITQG